MGKAVQQLQEGWKVNTAAMTETSIKALDARTVVVKIKNRIPYSYNRIIAF
jgi:hypothetical protein